MNANPTDENAGRTTRITIACAGYKARIEGDFIVLEIDNAKPANLIPQLVTKDEVAKRLAISLSKVDGLMKDGRLTATYIDSCVRFKEENVLKLLSDASAPKVRVIDLNRRHIGG